MGQEAQMKWFLNILGILLVLAGLVWILQGVNILGGSYMSGQIQYSGLGIVTAAIGAGLLFWGYRRRKIQ
jgi:uncharacterized integral membrane protein